MRFLVLCGKTGDERLLATDVVRMISTHSVSSPFLDSGDATLAQFLRTLRFPGSAAFHRRVENFLPRAAVYVCVCVYACR